MNPARRKRNTPPLAGRFVHIVGSENLQNQLLAGFLKTETGVRCTYGETVTPAVLSEAQKRPPVLLLLDCFGQGLEDRLDRLGQRKGLLGPSCLVVFFNMRHGLGIEARALREGVRGFFYEKDSPESMVKGLKAVFAGELWVSREIMTRCLLEQGTRGRGHVRDPQVLTSREIEILSHIAIGATNREIGEKLCISTNTVKSHIYNIYHKIKVPNRLQAALWAAKHL